MKISLAILLIFALKTLGAAKSNSDVPNENDSVQTHSDINPIRHRLFFSPTARKMEGYKYHIYGTFHNANVGKRGNSILLGIGATFFNRFEVDVLSYHIGLYNEVPFILNVKINAIDDGRYALSIGGLLFSWTYEGSKFAYVLGSIYGDDASFNLGLGGGVLRESGLFQPAIFIGFEIRIYNSLWAVADLAGLSPTFYGPSRTSLGFRYLLDNYFVEAGRAYNGLNQEWFIGVGTSF